MVAIRAPVARFAGAALDLLLPPRCLACGAIVDRQGTLCAACWRGIAFVGPPMCACCGLPFEIAAGPGALCGACVASPPVWRRARAALVYDDGSRPLVLGFKHGDRTHAAVPFARWMAHAGAELLAGSDLVVPVPLHPWRLFRRRYNQSALLARAVARHAGVALLVDAVVRRRRTPSQGGLNRRQRALNVRGAFRVRRGAVAQVRGRRIVLVDDVLTTGATVTACARALLSAGAASVDVLALARVVRGGWNRAVADPTLL